VAGLLCSFLFYCVPSFFNQASELVHRGYLTIEGVRRAIKTRKLYLDRNQLVGVDCYEDIREEMDRKEVESIGRIVEQCTQEMHPGAEVRIMGSYRRGKDTCGDVDVHITHKSYVKKIPDTALGEIVDLMWKRGHLAFHLTFLSGMKTGSTIADYQESSRYIPRDAWEGSKVVGYSSTRSSEKSSSSYMGVLKSPVVEGRRRRVDFKFYPYRERIFASLYFTGNGYFNRSMRLWAGRKFNFILNDHGLFSSGTVDRVMEASEEREVFEKLQLVYKEPVERDCFDACEPKEGIVEMEDMEITEAEFFSGNAHVWIN
jgi:DNA polymerase lambda